jgi:hypothetical protein
MNDFHRGALRLDRPSMVNANITHHTVPRIVGAGPCACSVVTSIRNPRVIYQGRDAPRAREEVLHEGGFEGVDLV